MKFEACEEVEGCLVKSIEAGINPYYEDYVVDYLKEAGIYPQDFDWDELREKITDNNNVTRHLRSVRGKMLTGALGRPQPRFPTNQLCWMCDVGDRPIIKPRKTTIPH